MPQDGIELAKNALKSAKGALDNANNSNVASGNGKPFPPFKQKTPTPSPVKPAAKSSGLGAEAESAASGLKARMTNENAAVDSLKGSFKKGGRVPETGNYKLHKDEEVIPADKAKKMRKASEAEGALTKHGKAKHGMKHTHIEHHPNGSHTVRHTPHADADGKMPDEVSYAAKDMDELHDGMEQNLGEPSADEASAAPAPGAEGGAPAPAPAAGDEA
jgi:hypothetical protein